MFDLSTFPDIVVKDLEHIDNDSHINIVSGGHGFLHYTLYNKGIQWMTWNTFSNKQIKEFYSQYDLAHGKVLLTGFGFGFLASWIASKPDVESVTVIEISKPIVDIFLLNNELSKKINIIYDDASKYKTDEYFDCLFLDHYEFQYLGWILKDVKQICSNIPNHKTFWFWSLEERLSKSKLNLLGEKYIDFYPDYKDFKKILNIDSLPELNKEKINEYVYTYYDKIGYKVK